LDAFLAALTTNGTFSPSLEDGIAALALADAAATSATTGNAVVVPD
jgi:hypothetical protein